MSLGENIKAARKKKGITQKELSEKIGKGFSTVQKYEIDVIVPPIGIINKIADVLEVPIEELLTNTNTLLYNEEERKKFENVMDLMVKSLPQNKLIEAFNQLNDTGKSKVIDYAVDIAPKYPKIK